MPLTASVGFKAKLQKGNRFHIPRLIRWQFKMETNQILTITIRVCETGTEEEFLAQMSKDGRITIPKLIIGLLKENEKSMAGCVLDIEISPAD